MPKTKLPPLGLEGLLGSRARARILEALVTSPDREWGIRELAADAGLDFKSAWTVLAQLRTVGLVEAVVRDGATRQRWARAHPASRHVEGIVNELGATGILRVVREHLLALEWLEEAIVYGSWAKGTHGDGSDIDIILIGDTTVEQAHREMLMLEQRLGRPVDYRKWSRAEFEELRTGRDGLVPAILAGPHLSMRR